MKEGDSITIDAKKRLIELNVPAEGAGAAKKSLEGAKAALHLRRAGQVRQARINRQRRGDHRPVDG